MQRELRPNDTFGEYRLERKLGVGGMAEVWLAKPLAKRHPFPQVVLKRVHPHLTAEKRLLDLFFDEVRLARRLDHPNVVRVFDSGLVDDDYFMAMEFVDGLDLRRCLAAHGGPLWPAFAAQLVADACVGLEYAHTLKDENGQPLSVVHRDISPDNLMVSRQGVVKLLDFGVARAAHTESTTRTGHRRGKVRYMSPEYVRDHRTDAASDVYAMGATLFELCTGHKPFSQHGSITAVMNAILHQGLPRADAVRPSLPGELVSAIAAATERDPARRLRSARDLETRLRAFLRDYVPPSPSEIGTEVSLWLERVGTAKLGAPPPKRPPGSYGQLETTEFFRMSELGAQDPLDAPLPAPEVDPDPSVPVAPPTVRVAHALDLTEVLLLPRPNAPPPDSADLPTDPDLPIADRLPSVLLEPELERSAERSGKPAKPRKG